MKGLAGRLRGKVIHGVFVKQVEQEGFNMVASHRWLRTAHLKAVAEGLIVAAQDGVVQTSIPQHNTAKR